MWCLSLQLKNEWLICLIKIWLILKQTSLQMGDVRWKKVITAKAGGKEGTFNKIWFPATYLLSVTFRNVRAALFVFSFSTTLDSSTEKWDKNIYTTDMDHTSKYDASTLYPIRRQYFGSSWHAFEIKNILLQL